MKKVIRIIALLMVALFVFAACGSGGTPTPTTPAPAATTAPVAQDATTTPPAQGATEAPGLPPMTELPPIELTIHYVFAGHVWDSDWRVWDQIRELTGVTLTGTADPTNLVAATAFNLQAVEGFPAHIYGGTCCSI
jgi:ABC-type glycerol-3-phosphate transport system substrate-binding protein